MDAAQRPLLVSQVKGDDFWHSCPNLLLCELKKINVDNRQQFIACIHRLTENIAPSRRFNLLDVSEPLLKFEPDEWDTVTHQTLTLTRPDYQVETNNHMLFIIMSHLRSIDATEELNTAQNRKSVFNTCIVLQDSGKNTCFFKTADVIPTIMTIPVAERLDRAIRAVAELGDFANTIFEVEFLRIALLTPIGTPIERDSLTKSYACLYGQENYRYFKALSAERKIAISILPNRLKLFLMRDANNGMMPYEEWLTLVFTDDVKEDRLPSLIQEQENGVRKILFGNKLTHKQKRMFIQASVSGNYAV